MNSIASILQVKGRSERSELLSLTSEKNRPTLLIRLGVRLSALPCEGDDRGWSDVQGERSSKLEVPRGKASIRVGFYEPAPWSLRTSSDRSRSWGKTPGRPRCGLEKSGQDLSGLYSPG